MAPRHWSWRLGKAVRGVLVSTLRWRIRSALLLVALLLVPLVVLASYYACEMLELSRLSATNLAVARVLSDSTVPFEKGIFEAPQTRSVVVAAIEHFSQARVHCLSRAWAAMEEGTQVASAAARNLVGLACLIVVLLIWLFARLPHRLLSGLERLTGIMRQAAGGRTDVEAPEDGPLEIAKASRTFNAVVASFREINEKMKGRIGLDARVIEALLEQLSGPAALVTKGLRIEHTNKAMCELFPKGRLAAYGITDLAGPAGAGVLSAVRASAHSRTPCDVPVAVAWRGNRLLDLARLIPVTDDAGKVQSFVLLLLERGKLTT